MSLLPSDAQYSPSLCSPGKSQGLGMLSQLCSGLSLQGMQIAASEPEGLISTAWEAVKPWEGSVPNLSLQIHTSA